MKVTIVERVKKNDDQYRKEREKYFINKFNTFLQRNQQTTTKVRIWALVYCDCLSLPILNIDPVIQTDYSLL